MISRDQIFNLFIKANSNFNINKNINRNHWEYIAEFQNTSCGEKIIIGFKNNDIHLLSRACSFAMASFWIVKENFSYFFDFIKNNSDITQCEIILWLELYYKSPYRKECVISVINCLIHIIKSIKVY